MYYPVCLYRQPKGEFQMRWTVADLLLGDIPFSSNLNMSITCPVTFCCFYYSQWEDITLTCNTLSIKTPTDQQRSQRVYLELCFHFSRSNKRKVLLFGPVLCKWELPTVARLCECFLKVTGKKTSKVKANWTHIVNRWHASTLCWG